jgi:hypothetical protein
MNQEPEDERKIKPRKKDACIVTRRAPSGKWKFLAPEFAQNLINLSGVVSGSKVLTSNL